MRTLLAVLVISGTFVVGCDPTSTTPVRPTFTPIPLPDFTLTERSGKEVSKADLKGKVWVAAFVFTRCSGPCPRVSATMAKLQSQLAEVPDARLVTFTVDPAHDTPEVLSRYAENFQADPERWLFLTGDESKIHEIVKDGFAIDRRVNPEAVAGESVEHGTWLVLVDRDGDIVAHYDGIPGKDGEAAFEEQIAELVVHVKELSEGR